jgi:hypothetical protein
MIRASKGRHQSKQRYSESLAASNANAVLLWRSRQETPRRMSLGDQHERSVKYFIAADRVPGKWLPLAEMAFQCREDIFAAQL